MLYCRTIKFNEQRGQSTKPCSIWYAFASKKMFSIPIRWRKMNQWGKLSRFLSRILFVCRMARRRWDHDRSTIYIYRRLINYLDSYRLDMAMAHMLCAPKNRHDTVVKHFRSCFIMELPWPWYASCYFLRCKGETRNMNIIKRHTIGERWWRSVVVKKSKLGKEIALIATQLSTKITLLNVYWYAYLLSYMRLSKINKLYRQRPTVSTEHRMYCSLSLSPGLLISDVHDHKIHVFFSPLFFICSCMRMHLLTVPRR